MTSYMPPYASECIDRIRLDISPVEFGYKIQALAAHVLLRLGYKINEVNQSGHPDIVATKDRREFRFEVEAEVTGPRSRKLTDADFASLTESSNAVGYYALAISFPTPYWVLVPASKLICRKFPSSNMLLEALSDKAYSEKWTYEYVQLLQSACRQIKLASFGDLTKMAVAGRRL